MGIEEENVSCLSEDSHSCCGTYTERMTGKLSLLYFYFVKLAEEGKRRRRPEGMERCLPFACLLPQCPGRPGWELRSSLAWSTGPLPLFRCMLAAECIEQWSWHGNPGSHRGAVGVGAVL